MVGGNLLPEVSGPINGAHGHWRLNVLFARAKQQVCLFTSMGANDLRVEESTRWGEGSFARFRS
jgi:hypothetical protein